MSSTKADWVVYLLECGDGTYYCGVTNDLQQRIHKHRMGKGAKYTKGRGPFLLLGQSVPMSKGEALSLEYRIKRLPKNKKIDAIKANWQS